MEPTLFLTFRDFIIRTAEELGVADYSTGQADMPSDPHDRELCERIVNDAWRRFYNSNAMWNWTLRTFSIQFDVEGTGPGVVNGEPWRYYMPDGFYGDMLTPMTYAENTGRLPIHETNEADIRIRYASATVAGYPVEYAIRPLPDDPARRWEMIVWPRPNEPLVVTGRCRLYPNRLILPTDRPNCGFQFDEAILACCMAEIAKRKDDMPHAAQEWTEALMRAITMDQRAAPRHMGDYSGAKQPHGRFYRGVDGYRNLDGTVHT